MVYNQLLESVSVDYCAYVQLASQDSEAVHTALADLLRAIDRCTTVPAATAERQGVLRDALGGSRMLLLLDNVRDSQQLAELLPCLPATGSRVLVTSRCDYGWGSTHCGACHTFVMRRMPLEAARELFRHVRGADTPTEYKVGCATNTAACKYYLPQCGTVCWLVMRVSNPQVGDELHMIALCSCYAAAQQQLHVFTQTLLFGTSPHHELVYADCFDSDDDSVLCPVLFCRDTRQASSRRPPASHSTL